MHQQGGYNTVRAVSRNVAVSPRKAQLVAELIRGKSVEDALAILKNTDKKAATALYKTVKSAASNGVEERSFSYQEMTVQQAIVEQGRTLKRIQPRARGKADRILKRYAHLTVVLEGPHPF